MPTWRQQAVIDAPVEDVWLYFGALGKRHLRGTAEGSLDGLRRLLA